MVVGRRRSRRQEHFCLGGGGGVTRLLFQVTHHPHRFDIRLMRNSLGRRKGTAEVGLPGCIDTSAPIANPSRRVTVEVEDITPSIVATTTIAGEIVQLAVSDDFIRRNQSLRADGIAEFIDEVHFAVLLTPVACRLSSRPQSGFGVQRRCCHPSGTPYLPAAPQYAFQR